MRHTAFFLALCILGLGCGGRSPAGDDWATYHSADHRLVGVAWSSAEGGTVAPSDVLEAAAEADVVLLGEKHDNLDHHRLEAWVLRSLPRVGSVAFEMLDAELGPALEQRPPSTPAEVEEVTRWSEGGWPHFVMYEPVFAAALAQHARILAAHPDRRRLRQLVKSDVILTDDPTLKLEPFSADQRELLAQEIRESHCDMAPPEMVGRMVDAQRFKDAWMAARVVEAERPAVLVAGFGHTRRDVGAPLYLERQGAGRVVSVAFLEVTPGHEQADDPYYGAARYDYVVFTPRQDNEDPCARFRRQLEGMKKAPAEEAADPEGEPEAAEDAEPAPPPPDDE